MKKIKEVFILFIISLFFVASVSVADGIERKLTVKDKQRCMHIAGVAAGIQATRNSGIKLHKFYFNKEEVSEKYKIEKEVLWFLVKRVYFDFELDTHPAQVYNVVERQCGNHVFFSKPKVEYAL